MKKCKTTILTILLIGLIAFSGQSPVGASKPSSDTQKPLSICADKDGNPKRGQIDVVLLLDNSQSLNASRDPSDPTNQRYIAIRDLLRSLGEETVARDNETPLEINFEAISFGSNAEVVIPFTPLTTSNALELGKLVEAQVPPDLQKQSSTTNYVNALQKGLDEFSQRLGENCKILVWFTDGQFEIKEIDRNDPAGTSKRLEQASYLKTKVCEEGGFADQIGQYDISTFALVLSPKKSDPARLGASFGAMQAITGATSLPTLVLDRLGIYFDMCGDLQGRRHLGEVLLSDDAESIARKIPVIKPGDIGRPVGECPVGNFPELPAMPAARHLRQIQIVAFNAPTQIADVKGWKITDKSGIERPVLDYLEITGESSFEMFLSPNASGTQELDQGWRFKIDGPQEGWCLYLWEQDFSVKFGGPGEDDVAQSSSGGKLTKTDLDNLSYQKVKNNEVLPNVEAARSETGEVKAFLEIDPIKKLFENPVEVKVQQQSVPMIACQSIRLEEVGNIRESRRISGTCSIDTSETNLSEVIVSLEKLKFLESKDCNSKLLLALPEDREAVNSSTPLKESLALKKGITEFAVVLEAQGDGAICQSDDAYVQFLLKVPGKEDVIAERQVTIDVQWKKIPSTVIVWLLVFLAVLLATILNLLLLREIKKRSSVISKLSAYEEKILLTLDGNRNVISNDIDGRSLNEHMFTMNKVIPIKMDGTNRRGRLNGGSRKEILIKLPNILQPFGRIYLVLADCKFPYYFPEFENQNGLSPQITSALVLHSPVTRGDGVEATATLLFTGSGAQIGASVKELLANQLPKLLRKVKDDPNWFKQVESS